MSVLNVSSPLHTRTDDDTVDPSVVQLFVSLNTTDQYFNVALLTALVYHSVITLDKEIRFFWPNPRSSVSIIYFANRYTGLLSAVFAITIVLPKENLASCLFSAWITGLGHLAIVVMIDYILLIRVLALYHRNKRLFIVLIILLGLQVALNIGFWIYTTSYEDIATARLTEGLTICVEERAPPRMLAVGAWAFVMVYELVLLILALYKAVEYWRQSSGLKDFHLLRILIQDQALYYCFVIFCSVCQIIFASITDISPLAANFLGVAGSPILLCILGSHLLINLKEAGERGANGGTNYVSRTVSEMEFGENRVNPTGSV